MGSIRLYREAIMFIKCKVSVEANKLTIKKKEKKKNRDTQKRKKKTFAQQKVYTIGST